MDKVESQSSTEAAWQTVLLRHAQSRKRIAAFCRDEAVSTASFHIWRSKLAAADSHAAQPVAPTAFIDLGAIETVAAALMAHSPAVPRAPVPAPGIDVRIDLGGGIVLTRGRRQRSAPAAGAACKTRYSAAAAVVYVLPAWA